MGISVPVMKPDGSLRLCVDFRKLNSVTRADPYYMPLMDKIVDKLGEAKHLSKLKVLPDLGQSLYISKTTFITPEGKFDFLWMPFGLRNAPVTFQRAMDEMLQGQQDHSSPYIDDVVIFSDTW